MKTIRMIAASAALLAVASCGDARAGAAATDTGIEQQNPEGSVPSSISCFVVRTQGKNILFDTGNGAARGGKMLERLKAAGIEPEEIDLVMLTHFHGDHIGGLVAADSAVCGRFLPRSGLQ